VEQNQQLQYWSRKFLHLFNEKVHTFFTITNVKTSVMEYLLTMKLNAHIAMICGKKLSHCVISSFHHGVNEIFTLLGCYTAFIGSLLLMGCPESSITNYQSKLHNIPKEQRSQPYTD
jgi:hypothetical protein